MAWWMGSWTHQSTSEYQRTKTWDIFSRYTLRIPQISNIISSECESSHIYFIPHDGYSQDHPRASMNELGRWFSWTTVSFGLTRGHIQRKRDGDQERRGSRGSLKPEFFRSHGYAIPMIPYCDGYIRQGLKTCNQHQGVGREIWPSTRQVLHDTVTGSSSRTEIGSRSMKLGLSFQVQINGRVLQHEKELEQSG